MRPPGCIQTRKFCWGGATRSQNAAEVRDFWEESLDYDRVMQVLRISHLAAGAVALTGCSLLYNPNNLPSPEVDAFVPVDPTALSLDGVGPIHLYEGQGTGGSRPAILAITGSNIAADAVVSLVPAGGQTAAPAPMLELDHASARRAASVVAVPVTVPIDPSRSEGDLQLTVQITQMTPEGPLTRTLEGVHVIVHSLPELDAPITGAPPPSAGFYAYSRVNVPDGLTFAARAAAPPVIIRAVSSIALGDVHVDAAGQTPGPGGAAGGAKLKSGSGPGGGMPGTLLDGGLVSGGSGGGFGQAGGKGDLGNAGGAATGDELLTRLATNTSSGGGGGGVNPGGGGGGVIELTAGGTLTIGTLTANGGIGGDGGVLAGAAGGGSGGAILLRSGGPAKVAMIQASGGLGGTTTANGGAGGGGRLRYDVPSFLDATPAMPVASRRGVAFLPDIPLITNDSRLEMPVISDVAPDVDFHVYVFDAKDVNTHMTVLTFPTPSVPVRPTLTVGYNRVCVTPPKGDPRVAESTNCIELAYVP